MNHPIASKSGNHSAPIADGATRRGCLLSPSCIPMKMKTYERCVILSLLCGLFSLQARALVCNACDYDCEQSCASQEGSCSYSCSSFNGIVSASCSCVQTQSSNEVSGEVIFALAVVLLFATCCCCVVVSCFICIQLLMHPFPVGCLISCSVLVSAIVAQVSVTGLVSDFFSLLFSNWQDLLPSMFQMAIAPAVGALTLVGINLLNYVALLLDVVLVGLEIWNFADLFVTDSLFPGITLLSVGIGFWIVCLTGWQFLMVARKVKEVKEKERQASSEGILVQSSSAPLSYYSTTQHNLSSPAVQVWQQPSAPPMCPEENVPILQQPNAKHAEQAARDQLFSL